MAKQYCPNCRTIVTPNSAGLIDTCPVCDHETRTARPNELAQAKQAGVKLTVSEAKRVAATNPHFDPCWANAEMGGYMVRLTERLYREYGIADHGLTVFRSMRSSYEITRNSRPQLVFGYADVDYCVSKGYRDYATIEPIWGGRVAGREAAYRIALHEFAHVLQVRAGGVSYRSVHNSHFVDCLTELMTLFPYSEVASL